MSRLCLSNCKYVKQISEKEAENDNSKAKDK